jgi:hypothetical protein
MKIRAAVAILLALAALAPRSARAHCHLQYQVIGPAGLFYEADMRGWFYRGSLPGGTTAQLGADVSWTDIRVLDISGPIQVGLRATDLTGFVACPAVAIDLTGVGGQPGCGDDQTPEVFPPCTPSFTVTQTAPHVFSCASACVSYPQPHVAPAAFAPPNSPAPRLVSLSPRSATAGSSSLAVAVDGSGFVDTSLAQWNGAPLTTVLVDNFSLLALLTSPLVADPGTNSVTVRNPGGASPPLAFAVLGSPAAPPDPSAGSIPDARVFPNPWSASLGAPAVTFDGMAPGSSVRIFTLSGRLVRTLDAPAGAARWDLTNSPGEAVASGFYLYLLTGGDRTQRGRLAIIR